MTKRKVEIFIIAATETEGVKAGYDIFELSGPRTYVNVGSDTDLDVEDLDTAITADLTALDA